MTFAYHDRDAGCSIVMAVIIQGPVCMLSYYIIIAECCPNARLKRKSLAATQSGSYSNLSSCLGLVIGLTVIRWWWWRKNKSEICKSASDIRSSLYNIVRNRKYTGQRAYTDCNFTTEKYKISIIEIMKAIFEDAAFKRY